METTYLKQLLLLRTGELARALLLYYTQTIISTTKNAGEEMRTLIKLFLSVVPVVSNLNIQTF